MNNLTKLYKINETKANQDEESYEYSVGDVVCYFGNTYVINNIMSSMAMITETGDDESARWVYISELTML